MVLFPSFNQDCSLCFCSRGEELDWGSWKGWFTRHSDDTKLSQEAGTWGSFFHRFSELAGGSFCQGLDNQPWGQDSGELLKKKDEITDVAESGTGRTEMYEFYN